MILDLNTMEVYNTCKEVGEVLGLSPIFIKSEVDKKNKRWVDYDYYNSLSKEEQKRVKENFLDTLSIICLNDGKVYNNIYEIIQSTDRTYYELMDVLHGKRNCTMGKVYMYMKDYENSTQEQLEERLNSILNKRVQCIDTGEIFDSVAEASIKLGLNRNHIGEVCNGKRKTCGKMKFRYVKRKINKG